MNKQIVEGLIFLSGDEGLTKEQLMMACEISEVELEKYIDELMDDCANRGIELVHFGEKYKYLSREEVHEYAQKIYSSSKMANLSPSALETLAIIAYKQPITRSEIEEIRGISCDNMLRKLSARGLIQENGRSDAPGRPFLYEVTDEFMDTFKLTSLKELPILKTIDENEENDFLDVKDVE